jgi:hypothetical protein
MAFRSKFHIGATKSDIYNALHPEQYLRADSDIIGNRWIEIKSNDTVIRNEYNPEIYVQNQLPAGDTALIGTNNEHKLHA